MGEPLLSIITPVFNEQESLDEYYERVSRVFEGQDFRVELILVDDGSTDKSWKKIEELSSRDARVRGIRLSRNFGVHLALSAGIDDARGDAVTILATDLQDPPETILDFVREWRGGAEVVWGRRTSRKEGPLRAGLSGIFRRVLVRAAFPWSPKFATGSFLLADRCVVEEFKRFRERHRLTFAVVAWSGFSQATVDYERQARSHGKSRWSLYRLTSAFIDAFVGYSYLPIRLISYLGIFVGLLTIPIIVYAIVSKLTGHTLQPGWTSIVVLVLLVGGLLLVAMGILGEYIYRLHQESVGRPLYIVRDTTGRGGESDEDS